MGTLSDHGLTEGSTPSDYGIDPADFSGDIATPNDGEVHFTPKASSTGARGTMFFSSDDDYLYVAREV